MARESFKRYVEVGRVVLLLNGENKNKIAVIAEIIDQNKVRFRTETGGTGASCAACTSDVRRCARSPHEASATRLASLMNAY